MPRQVIFAPGTTRAEIESTLAHENRIGLGVCAFLALLALAGLFLDEPGYVAVPVLLIAVFAIGGQWEHSRRRRNFMIWEMEQERIDKEDDARRQRDKSGIPGIIQR